MKHNPVLLGDMTIT